MQACSLYRNWQLQTVILKKVGKALPTSHLLHYATGVYTRCSLALYFSWYMVYDLRMISK